MDFLPGESKMGPRGAASIAIVGVQLQVVFDQNNEVVNLPLATLPPNCNQPRKLPQNKKYMVAVNGAHTELNTFHPFVGTVICKFIGFKKRRNDPVPMPLAPFNKEGKNDKGGTYTKDWLEFTALCEIIDAPYTGLVVPIKFRYYFGPSADGNAGIVGGGKHSVKLARFLEVIAGDGTKVKVPFSDNVLPALEAFLLEYGRPFQIILANGYADAFGEAPAIYLKKSGSKKTAAKKATKKAAPKKK